MKIFIDSAKLDEIEHAYSSGIIDGVTTNPSLIKKAVEDLKKKGQEIDMRQYIESILRTAKGTPVSIEVTEYNYQGMVEQGKSLFRMFNPIANNVCIKIPVNTSFEAEHGREFEGIRAVKTLSAAGIPVNCTLIFTPEQALLAAKAGASFVSPFAGRIDDSIRKESGVIFSKSDYFPAEGIRNGKGMLDDNGIVSGIDLVRQIADIFRKQGIKSEVLAASLRNARQVREAALAGAHIATLPVDVIKELLSNRKTQEGMKSFTADIIPEYADLAKER
ncbi:MAG: transaldolase [Candidatus Woesearchaeota archaeon]|nr:transaldolase [Candidatus Woesearchaeota archaeon]